MKLNTVLPMAEYISNEDWAVSTATPIKFNVLCHEDKLKFAVSNPPINILHLDMTCLKSCDKMTLPPYYQQENTFVINATTLNWIQKYALSDVTSWEPYHKAIPVFTHVQLPEQLDKIEKIDMNHLINRLKGLDQIVKTHGWSWWQYVALVTIVIIVVVIIGKVAYFYIRWKRTGSLGASPITEF